MNCENLIIYSYMVKNFNDFFFGMVVFFDLFIIGNWYIWMDVSVIVYIKIFIN